MANTLVDWVWGSGTWGIKIPQRLLGLKEDGVVGYVTVNALNKAVKENKKFITKLYKARYDYINSIIKSNSKLAVFKTGWLNRMKDLEKIQPKIFIMENTQQPTEVNIQVEFTIMQFKLQLLALAKDNSSTR